MNDLKSERDSNHYQATFKYAGAGLARVDLNGNFTDMNPAFCELLGYTRQELLKRDFFSVTHPDDVDANANLLHAVQRGEINSYRMQKRYIRANGEVLWADLAVSAEMGPSNDIVGLISIITDIRGFKFAEERMDFLMAELAHRSKNLFAVVHSIVNLTNAETVEEFRRRVQLRIQGLAASQNLMLGTSPISTYFAQMARLQLDVFLAPGDKRVHLKCIDLELGVNAARILSMAIHELATNSCKYGSLSTLQGQVYLTCEEDADPNFVILHWVERRGPEVRPPDRSGFGRRVIERMVARSLNAEVRLDFPPAGVIWQCRIPKENLKI